MIGDNHVSFLLQGLHHSSKGKHGLPIPFERHPLDAWAFPTFSKQPIGTMGSMCQALWGIYVKLLELIITSDILLIFDIDLTIT